MGHHFDSPEARADSRINITDNYLFESPNDASRVIAVMCMSPLAGLPSPYHGQPQWRTFRPTAAYELRFDTDGDMIADRVLRLVFQGEEAPQTLSVHWLEGEDAQAEGATGKVLGTGSVEATVELELPQGMRGKVWSGEAGDPFWLDAVSAKVFLDLALSGTPAGVETFSRGQITTGGTNVLAIVADLPMALFGRGPWHFYSAVSANDHGHFHQVARCGRPNFAATFVDNPERSRLMNDTTPDQDLDLFTPDVVKVVEVAARNVGRVRNPSAYAQRVARWILPDVIGFDPQLPAGFDFAGLNGRRLDDDFGSVVYSAVFGCPVSSRLEPLTDLRDDWPFLPRPRPLPGGPAVSVPRRTG
ncbi:MAG: DUF4331 family protein [Myxococcales bacterium]